MPVQEISQTQEATVLSQEQTPQAPQPGAPLQPGAPPQLGAPPPHAAALPQPTSPPTSANNATGGDVEAGTVAKAKCKRKTTQNDQSHGSFFLRIGAIGKFVGR